MNNSKKAALGIILLLWVVYTVVYSLHPSDPLAVLLEIIPGILAICALSMAGFKREAYYLRFAPISKTGIIFLVASLISLPIMIPSGRWIGWDWTAALIYAPASAIAQELFFRSALLPGLMAVTTKKGPIFALWLHSTLFALWHVPKAYLGGAPLGGIIGVIVVTFLCGTLWGNQVQRDRTIIWATGVHFLILVINSLYTWG